MKLYTDIGESTVNVFEKILVETKLQRSFDQPRIENLIMNKINKFISHYKMVPDTIRLGNKEYGYFPDKFNHVLPSGELLVLKVENTCEVNGIDIVKPKLKEMQNEVQLPCA